MGFYDSEVVEVPEVRTNDVFTPDRDGYLVLPNPPCTNLHPPVAAPWDEAASLILQSMGDDDG